MIIIFLLLFSSSAARKEVLSLLQGIETRMKIGG